MGTYTTNYQLYIPTVGEQGWGTLVNGNFTTIDTTMDNLNTRLTAVESEVNGDLNCTSVTTSGTITSTGKVTANGGIGTTSLTTSSTITSTGKITANGGVGTTSLTTSSTITSTGLITANGGVKGNITGNCYGKLYVTASYATSGEILAATCNAQTASITEQDTNSSGIVSSTITVAQYSKKSLSFPLRLSPGVYVEKAANVSGSIPTLNSRTLVVSGKISRSAGTGSHVYLYLYVNNSLVKTWSATSYGEVSVSHTQSVSIGDTAYLKYVNSSDNHLAGNKATVTINANSSYYVREV